MSPAVREASNTVSTAETSRRNGTGQGWLAMVTPDPAFFLAEAGGKETGQEEEPPYRGVGDGTGRRTTSRED